jgi:hypothetical protein
MQTEELMACLSAYCSVRENMKAKGYNVLALHGFEAQPVEIPSDPLDKEILSRLRWIN